jgi:hypothetical protein
MLHIQFFRRVSESSYKIFMFNLGGLEGHQSSQGVGGGFV